MRLDQADRDLLKNDSSSLYGPNMVIEKSLMEVDDLYAWLKERTLQSWSQPSESR